VERRAVNSRVASPNLAEVARSDMEETTIEKKERLLGESYGAATARLRKEVLFQLLVNQGLNVCFQCGKEIAEAGDISIEHKVPWMSAENPKEAFYDLDNVAISHLRCNVRAGNHKVPRPNNRGELNGSAKLNWDDVEQIRKKIVEGVALETLSEEYGVTTRTLRLIKNSDIWK
jgi:hypothetical protein